MVEWSFVMRDDGMSRDASGDYRCLKSPDFEPVSCRNSLALADGDAVREAKTLEQDACG
jgi:hypothetical protein